MPDPRRNTEREVLDCLIALHAATAHMVAFNRVVGTIKHSQRILNSLHKAKRVYISSWIHYAGRGPWTKVYTLGNPDEMLDAKRPKPIPGIERTRASRNKKRLLEISD